MRKFILMNMILSVSALGFVGCAPSSTDANKPILNTNTAATNSNMNTATMNSNANSNANSNVNSNASSNVSKTTTSSDKEFMEKASQGGKTESQLGNVAIMKSQNEEIKVFGQKMINDHSKANSELSDLAKQRGVELPTMSLEQTQRMSDLAQLSGAAFDKAYIKEMIADHEQAIADFQKQANTGTDAEVKKFAAATLPTLKMHLEIIKALQSKIK